MKTSFYSEKELKKFGFKNIGENVLISKKASFYGEQNISFANNIRIDDFCILSGKIKIGNHVHIAAGSVLIGSNKGITFDDFAGCSHYICIYAVSDTYSGYCLTNPTIPNKYRKVIQGAVFIEKYVIIGAGSIVLPSVRIREGAAIGALSLVDKSTDAWKIYSGNPAKPIKNRSKKLLEFEKELLADNIKQLK